MSWDPGQYLRFGDARLRPALDLLDRIGAYEPGLVVDAGCGPGTVIPHIARRWPRARVVGVDASPEMLREAEASNPGVELVEADLARWEPDAPLDVLFSNATLHWLDDHEELFPRLAGLLAPGGWLAVQMPFNHHAPSHTIISEVVAGGPWASRLAPIERPFPVAEVPVYQQLFSPLSAHLEIWETVYWQALVGVDPVAEWAKGSVLRPLLAALDPEARPAFLAEYADRVRPAYPPGDDGTTWLPFRRLFIVVQARPG